MENKNLNNAKRNKKDEFYTRLSDIENELRHYHPDHFKNKVVLCNCDDPRVSNFVYYFLHNFDRLRLKKLIGVCYKNQLLDMFSKNEHERAIYLEYEGSKKGNRIPDTEDIGIRYLKGDGDFRSPECIDLLKQADIVCTNPPFSLFREYVSQLMGYEKKFLIIGSMNAITYKEIFPLIKYNKLWLGHSFNTVMNFNIPDDYDQSSGTDKNGKRVATVSGICWFTNLSHNKQNEELILVKKYYGNEKDYPKYDNYDAIEVGKTKNIPLDYDGIMGVPISFLDKYNPNQFELIGCNRGIEQDPNKVYGRSSFLNGEETFKRLFIRRKNR